MKKLEKRLYQIQFFESANESEQCLATVKFKYKCDVDAAMTALMMQKYHYPRADYIRISVVNYYAPFPAVKIIL